MNLVVREEKMEAAVEETPNFRVAGERPQQSRLRWRAARVWSSQSDLLNVSSTRASPERARESRRRRECLED